MTIFAIMFHILGSSKLNALISASSLCLRAFVKMDFDNGMKSVTYKIILFFTLTCGFVIFSHYETVFASILIVKSENLPYKSWRDIANSGKDIYVLFGGSTHDFFKDAIGGSAMKEIYNDGKIKDINPIGHLATVPEIANGNYFVFDDSTIYKALGVKEYPCSISTLKTRELM